MFSSLVKIFKSFSKKELVVFGGAILIFLIALVVLGARFIYKNTEIIPVEGGTYTEGVVGQPSFINPVLAVSDADRDLTTITFANLADLAESYKVDNTGKIWRYRLKDGLKWQDGEKITSNDIIFTIATIQNPDVFSPLASNWQSVATTRISEKEIEIRLPAPYVFFQSILLNLQPIPQHLFTNIPAANLRISNYNFEPIGSGSYKFITFSKSNDGFINSYTFERNESYSGDRSYLNRINFSFFIHQEDLLRAFNRGNIDGFELGNVKNENQLIFPHQIFSLKTLKYYAIFLNSNAQPILKDASIRRALNLATNKQEIIDKVFNGEASTINGPLIKIGNTDNSTSAYSAGQANALLNRDGWIVGADGIRTKGTDRLEFTLIAPDIDFLKKTADLLAADWQKIGAKINIQTASLDAINDNHIKTRDYQMLIFGNIIGRSPDLFSFWHSSEKLYPGLNLALYENKFADSLIESIRKNFNDQQRQNSLEQLRSTIEADQPAIFLYSPNYFYAAKKDLFGFDQRNDDYIAFTSERLNNISKWYINTARILK